MTDDLPVRLGIVGFGVQGSYYARALNEGAVPGVTLGAVCDIDPTALAAASDLGVPTYRSHHDLAVSGEVEAIVTTVPHFQHSEVAIAGLRAGVHVIVEKPAAVEAAAVRELIAVAEQHPQLRFAVMLNQRTNPLFRQIKDLISSGEFGAIRRSNWLITRWWRPQSYYDASPWRATWGGEGGGVLVNQAPHQLDLWQWICGMPRSVVAKLGFGFRRDIVVEDEATILADFGDGVTGTFVTSTHDLVGTDRLEILCDRGKILVEDSVRAIVTRLDEPEQSIAARVDAQEAARLMSGGESRRAWSTTTIEAESHWGGQHTEVLRNFGASIRGREPLHAPGAESLNAVLLANAAHLSAWSGTEVPIEHAESRYLAELNARIRDEGLYPERPDLAATAPSRRS